MGMYYSFHCLTSFDQAYDILLIMLKSIGGIVDEGKVYN